MRPNFPKSNIVLLRSSLGSLPCGRCFTYANNIKDLFAILGEVV